MKHIKKGSLLLSLAAAAMPLSGAQASSCPNEYNKEQCVQASKNSDQQRQNIENEKLFGALIIFGTPLLAFLIASGMDGKQVPARGQTSKPKARRNAKV